MSDSKDTNLYKLSNEELIEIIKEKDAIIEKEKQKKDDLIKEKEDVSLKALINTKEEIFKITLTDSLSSNTNGNYVIAKGSEEKFKLLTGEDLVCYLKDNERDLDQSTVKQFVKEVNKGKESFNLSIKSEADLSIKSEADIRDFLCKYLDDALKIMGLFGNFSVHAECAMFSCRPDLLVVTRDDVSVLVIEIKKPVTKDLKEFPKVLGQCYDYLRMQRANGQPDPLLILSCFEKTIVCWDSIEKEPKDYSNVPSLSGTETITGGRSTSISPPKLVSSNSMSSNEDSKTLSEPLSLFVGDSERKIYHSKEFSSSDLIRVLCTALGHVKDLKYHDTKGAIHELSTEHSEKFPHTLRVVENNYMWGRCHFQVNTSIESTPHSSHMDRAAKRPKIDENDGKPYYLISQIGRGSTSVVWQALDAQGKEVAIKMYVRVNEEAGNLLTKDEIMVKTKEMAELEVKMYREIYEETFDDEVKFMKLASRNCLVMPIFRPIRKEERASHLKAVKNVLEKFKEAGVAYKDEDVRWRHVGLYKDQCFLFDLADLGNSTDSCVDEQHQEFDDRK